MRSLAIVGVLALPLLTAPALASGNGGPSHCKPRHHCPHPWPTPTPTATPTPSPTPTPTPSPVPGPQGPPGPAGPPGPQGPPGPVVIVPGPTPGTVIVNVGGITVTLPGTLPSASGACVNTRRSGLLWLPKRFTTHRIRRVRVRINGRNQFHRTFLRPNTRGHRGRYWVRVRVAGLPCGVYPVEAHNRRVRPALRIWSLTGGKRLVRFTIGNPGRPPSA